MLESFGIDILGFFRYISCALNFLKPVAKCSSHRLDSNGDMLRCVFCWAESGHSLGTKTVEYALKTIHKVDRL